MLKTYTNKKLFHGTYLYKLQVRTPISSVFYKKKNEKNTIDHLFKLQGMLNEKGIIQLNRWKAATKEDLDTAESILTKLIDTTSEYKLRCESYSLSIYTNDLPLLENIAKDMPLSARAMIWKPEERSVEFLLNNKDMSVSLKPVAFPYKIYLKSDMHRTNYDALVKWIGDNKEKVKIGKWCLNALKNHAWITGNYFYIKDLKTLTVIEMIAGKIINKVENIKHIDEVDKN